MKGPTLLILAAGMGSRYGGLKQMTPVSRLGNSLMDYSVFDAVRTGFKKIVFLIRKEIHHDFHHSIRIKYGNQLNHVIIHQSLDDLPHDFKVPRCRIKPWGTAHAVLSARHVIHEPFCVINADDYYGPEAFRKIAQFLKYETNLSQDILMVCYKLRNTLSEYGCVSRAICTSEKGYLTHLEEHKEVFLENGQVLSRKNNSTCFLSENSDVSMNIWGFSPDLIFPLLKKQFHLFIRNNLENPDAEFYLPTVINDALHQNHLEVKTDTTKDRWLGITYSKDLPYVQAKISEHIQSGLYPEKLFPR